MQAAEVQVVEILVIFTESNGAHFTASLCGEGCKSLRKT